MATLEEAVVALVLAQDEVRRLGKAISDALNDSYAAQTKNGGEYTDWLKLAYEHDYEGEGQYSDTEFEYVNHDDDVEGYLAEHCLHALRAHRLIQDRKEARKQLGIARRRISVMGKALIEERGESDGNQD